ncbi:MAG: hypothetical protein WCQ95_05830 [Bacteroidota bacterium]
MVLRLADLYKEKLPAFDTNSTDTLFAHGQTLIYGMLPDTSSYFGLITMDHYGPILTTYDKNGVSIFAFTLKVRDCPNDICITYWTETTTIDSSLNIRCVDTIRTSVPQGQNPSGCTNQHYCLSKQGKINRDGTIIMSEERNTAILSGSNVPNSKKHK